MSKVVRTGPDRPVGPVEPGTGPPSGPSQPQNRSAHEPVIEPENRPKTGKNRPKPEKTGLKKLLIFLIEKIKKIHKLSGVNLIPLKVTLNDDQSSGRLQMH
jgi:hypothetical protein